ncbi:unnamed protein product [Schistosoma mattheei]|uniref:Uncharacterized protein n=1 Tax=Schistosoma mattheei TaxID=31246 RepID=A0A183P2F6_9TREM|nr:unnamed protein product [Schistosoma mattheei]
MGEDKPDSSGGRNQEALEVDRTNIEESNQLRHNASPHLESSRPKEEKIKEHIMPRNGDKHEKNEQQSDRTRKEGPEQIVVVFEKSFPDNQWVELDRTETIHNHLNPDFAKKIVMEYHFEEQQRLNFVDFLGNCETTLGEIASSGKISKLLKPLVIACIDWNRSGSLGLFYESNLMKIILIHFRESLIGEITTSANELLTMFNNGIYSLDVSNNLVDGNIFLSIYICYYEMDDSRNFYVLFLEFEFSLQSGTELSCCIAIDFTASNGSPQVPGTLHYSTVTQPSQYAVALQAVGEIISDYDSDNLFPSFGFGACIPPDNNVSHCFPLVS